jgi:hypothetical protein
MPLNPETTHQRAIEQIREEIKNVRVNSSEYLNLYNLIRFHELRIEAIRNEKSQNVKYR